MKTQGVVYTRLSLSLCLCDCRSLSGCPPACLSVSFSVSVYLFSVSFSFSLPLSVCLKNLRGTLLAICFLRRPCLRFEIWEIYLAKNLGIYCFEFGSWRAQFSKNLRGHIVFNLDLGSICPNLEWDLACEGDLGTISILG